MTSARPPSAPPCPSPIETPTAQRLLSAAAVSALVIGLILATSAIVVRADGAGVLFVVEDGAGDERRADALVLASWRRSCDELRLTSIPRDLVITPDTEVAAVRYETDGARGLAKSLGDALGVDIGTVVTIDLRGAELVTEAIGPVTIDLAAESLDRRTGFHAGPGPVELVGETAIEFLRSRTWEEYDGTEWRLVANSDRDRMRRAQTYVARAIDRVADGGTLARARVVESALRNASLVLVDRLAFSAFIATAGSADRVVHDIVPVAAERAIDERRSPFAPAHLEAGARTVLDSGFAASFRACEGGLR